MSFEEKNNKLNPVESAKDHSAVTNFKKSQLKTSSSEFRGIPSKLPFKFYFDIRNIEISTSIHMVGRTIWDKLLGCIFKDFDMLDLNEGNFKIFKIHVGDLSPELPKPNVATS